MNENYKDLAENHYQLVEIIVDSLLSKQYYRDYKRFRDELIGEGSIALIKSAQRYDPTRNIKFSTFCSKRIKGSLLNLIEKKISKHCQLEIDIDSIDPNELVQEEQTEQQEEIKDDRIDVHNYAPSTELQKIVYYKVIIGNNSAKEVAEEIKVPVNTIYQLKNRILKKLRDYSKYLNKEDYYNKGE